MIDERIIDKVKAVAHLLKAAHHGIAFSGAGISTESGIPDFRSTSSGIWNNVDPMEVASIYGFKRNPQAFYKWVRPLTDLAIQAEPNPAHYALVDLEKMGCLHTIITQNIDMLHTKAGSKCIYEVHGHLRGATCTHCLAKYDGEALIQQFLKDSKVPYCEQCGHVIKPDVILFGEQLPIAVWQAAQEESRKSDVMLIIGSSLEVAPAGDLPLLARRNDAKLVIINQEPTPLDKLAEVVIHARAAAILPEIVRQLGEIS